MSRTMLGKDTEKAKEIHNEAVERLKTFDKKGRLEGLYSDVTRGELLETIELTKRTLETVIEDSRDITIT